jgi:hypothetical protein
MDNEEAMTDRIHSLTVVLADDIGIDDAIAVINAIMLLRGVLTVMEVPHPTAATRARRRLQRAAMNALAEVHAAIKEAEDGHS